MNELVAKVFVDAGGEVRDSLADFLRVSSGLSAIDCDVRSNREKATAELGSDDWLLYSTVVEVYSDEGAVVENLLPELARVLAMLDVLGTPYVTASDLEDELPNRGRRP